jgi:hypothetical protein
MAPVEVNVLKVISSLNDGGTNVLHFEKMLRAGRKIIRAPQPPAVAAGCPGCAAIRTEIVEPAASPQESDVQAPVMRPWGWWLAGGVAAVAVAAVVRYALPRWKNRSQLA